MIKGDKELFAKLRKLETLDGFIPVIQAAAIHVKGAISVYPSDSLAHRKQPFVSEKQRRYFFWALSEGIIEVPYRRGQSPGSQDHSSSWTVVGFKGGLRQVVGSNTSYGKFLQDPDEQSAYHEATGWQDTDKVMLAEEETVLQMMKEQMDKLLAS